MEVKITRKKHKLSTVDKHTLTINHVESKVVLIDDYEMYKVDSKICLWNGVIVFFGIETKKDLVERLAKFDDINQFWKAVKDKRANKPPEEILEEVIKFGNCERQNELLKQMGLNLNRKRYYCSLTYAMSSFFKFDVVAIDEELKEIYKDEYPDDCSMADFITNKWGKEFYNEFKSYF